MKLKKIRTRFQKRFSDKIYMSHKKEYVLITNLEEEHEKYKQFF